jgi:hypothetical protein
MSSDHNTANTRPPHPICVGVAACEKPEKNSTSPHTANPPHIGIGGLGGGLPDLMHQLTLRGLTLRRVGCNEIEVVGPLDQLTPDLKHSLRAHKSVLLEILGQPPTPPPPPTVVNTKSCPPGWETDPTYVYIGRGGRGRRKSPFANAYKVKEYGNDQNLVVAMYRERLDRRPDLVAKALAELGGKILVCHCKPKACHGDCLAELFINYESEERLAIQQEYGPPLGETLAELCRWFERRDQWHGRTPVVECESPPVVQTDGDSNPNLE